MGGGGEVMSIIEGGLVDHVELQEVERLCDELNCQASTVLQYTRAVSLVQAPRTVVLDRAFVVAKYNYTTTTVVNKNKL